jgi:hypothetical protein
MPQSTDPRLDIFWSLDEPAQLDRVFSVLVMERIERARFRREIFANIASFVPMILAAIFFAAQTSPAVLATFMGPDMLLAAVFTTGMTMLVLGIPEVRANG